MNMYDIFAVTKIMRETLRLGDRFDALLASFARYLVASISWVLQAAVK